MKLKVLGEIITVKSEPLENHSLRGYYDDDKKEIKLCTSLKDKEKAQTLIHELAHAALMRIHLGRVLNTETHETIVDVIATAITENFELKWKRNKK